MDLWNARQYRLPTLVNIRWYAGILTLGIRTVAGVWVKVDSDTVMLISSQDQLPEQPEI